MKEFFLFMNRKIIFIFITLLLPVILPAQQFHGKHYVNRADTLLNTIIKFFDVPKYGLLSETYPKNPEQKITYTINKEEIKQQETSFLWPYSTFFSGCVSIYKITGDEKYKRLIEDRVKPGLDKYWDTSRKPECYQSYPIFAGKNDRYYDDNDWIALDCCDYYELTGDTVYLNIAKKLYKYIYSGWSEELGGGIYWCEQQKGSKNTCSNAPATVLCVKLYNLTGEELYLQQAIKTYRWTRKNLMDPEDGVYWDNINLKGEIGKAKFTYNSGQMIQAGVLLYKATGDVAYLREAQYTARGAYYYFCKSRKTVMNDERLFYPSTPWFNVVLFRGLKALYEVDSNPAYVLAMIENADFAWKHSRNHDGLFCSDWTGFNNTVMSSLLDNACMIELYAEISNINISDTVGVKLTGNPVFPGWYADPEGIVYGDTYWIFPTLSLLYGEDRYIYKNDLNRKTDAINQEYNLQTHFDAFSSKDLVNWTKHSKVLSIENVKWVKYALWAPSVIHANNRYYIFFGGNDIQNNGQLGGIGVAVADKPEGPYRDAIGKPLINKIINGAQPIDQFVFKDDDGKYYMYYGGWGHCNVVRLSESLTDIIPFDDGETFKEITPEKYVEGPFMMKRNGKYYFMWSEGGWGGPDYSVAYAISDSPLGPFKRIGKILQQDPNVATGAGHHSVITIPGSDEHYIVYHRRPLGCKLANERQVCIDKMEFDDKGYIKPIKITFDGISPVKIR